MAFIDTLPMQLFVLGFSALVLVYITTESYSLWKNGKNIRRGVRSAQIPLAVLGGYALLMGIYGQIVWPLPGAYNILFYDVYVMFGLVMVSLAWALHSDLKARYAGILSLLAGAVTILYGISGYSLDLTSAPIALLALYGLFGFGAILAYPVTIMIDRAQERVKNSSTFWIALVGLFALVMLVAGLLALFIGVSAIPGHLASPP